jgi:hypothetical protein
MNTLSASEYPTHSIAWPSPGSRLSLGVGIGTSPFRACLLNDGNSSSPNRIGLPSASACFQASSSVGTAARRLRRRPAVPDRGRRGR